MNETKPKNATENNDEIGSINTPGGRETELSAEKEWERY
jgi:hypothetical protein